MQFYLFIHSCEQHSDDPVLAEGVKVSGIPCFIFIFIYCMLFNQFMWRESLCTGDRDAIFEQGSDDSLCSHLVTESHLTASQTIF